MFHQDLFLPLRAGPNPPPGSGRGPAGARRPSPDAARDDGPEATASTGDTARRLAGIVGPGLRGKKSESAECHAGPPPAASGLSLRHGAASARSHVQARRVPVTSHRRWARPLRPSGSRDSDASDSLPFKLLLSKFRVNSRASVPGPRHAGSNTVTDIFKAAAAY